MASQILKTKKSLSAQRRPAGRGESALLSEIIIDGDIHIPASVTDFDSFHRWVLSPACPERGRFSFMNGVCYVEVYSELVNHLSKAEWQRMHDRAIEPIRKRRSEAKNGRATTLTITDMVIDELIQIPGWVRDFASFRQWTLSEDFPEHGRIAFLGGKLWVDMTMETDIHSQIKTVITIVVGAIVLNEALGRFYADKMRLNAFRGGLSNEPDAMFVSNVSLDKGRAVLKEGDQSMEVGRSADMVLEVVSQSSKDKDLVDGMTIYAKAGIPEYWLVDSTAPAPDLVIMSLVRGKYVAARRHDGWVKSKVFGRSFRLTCRKDAKGRSHFNLETK